MPKIKIQEKSPNFILENIEKQMVPCKSTAEEVSFVPDLKVKTALHVFIIYPGSERV